MCSFVFKKKESHVLSGRTVWQRHNFDIRHSCEIVCETVWKAA